MSDLAQRIPCPECLGYGDIARDTRGLCPRCAGIGQVPAPVSGAEVRLPDLMTLADVAECREAMANVWDFARVAESALPRALETIERLAVALGKAHVDCKDCRYSVACSVACSTATLLAQLKRP